MSQSLIEEMRCPGCREVSDFPLWPALNSAQHPELKEQLLSRELFTFVCPHCGAKTPVDYGMRYHDPKTRLLIDYLPREEDLEEVSRLYRGENPEALEALEGLTSEELEHYCCRIVQSQNDLIEKIRIFSSGKDDRLMEFLKVSMAAQILRQNDSIRNFNLYYEGDKHADRFAVVGIAQHYGTVDAPEGAYAAVESRFQHKLPPLNTKEELLIDFHWASEKMGLSAG